MGKSAVVAAGAGVAASTAAVAQEAKPEKRVIHANGKKPDKTPLFSGMVA